MRVKKDKLQAHLKKIGLTQKELARRFGVSPRRVNFWFDAYIAYPNLVKLCDMLGVFINEYAEFDDFKYNSASLTDEEKMFLDEEMELERFWDDE